MLLMHCSDEIDTTKKIMGWSTHTQSMHTQTSSKTHTGTGTIHSHQPAGSQGQCWQSGDSLTGMLAQRAGSICLLPRPLPALAGAGQTTLVTHPWTVTMDVSINFLIFLKTSMQLTKILVALTLRIRIKDACMILIKYFILIKMLTDCFKKCKLWCYKYICWSSSSAGNILKMTG